MGLVFVCSYPRGDEVGCCSGWRTACPKVAARGWWGRGAACLREGKARETGSLILAPTAAAAGNVWILGKRLLYMHSASLHDVCRVQSSHIHMLVHAVNVTCFGATGPYTWFFSEVLDKIWESCSSGVAMPGAVSLEPPSLSTQSLLLMLALENAVKVSWHDSSTGMPVCAPGGTVSDGKTAKAEWCCTEQTWQNIPLECGQRCWNLCENLKKCIIKRSSWKWGRRE